MKEKILYFWNDLEIFFPNKKSELEEVDKKLQDFFAEISQTENVTYKYLSLQETRMWCEKMQVYMETPCIYLGTRPNKIFLNRNEDSIALYPQRKRSSDGRTKTVVLSEEDKELLRVYVRKEDRIRIVEDVLVCGVTMTELLKEIGHSLSENQDILIDIFAKNIKSAVKMEKKFRDKLYIQCFCEMQGESISESTCICAYDILDGKFKDMGYDECIDKLHYFFGRYTYEILDCMRSIKNKLLS